MESEGANYDLNILMIFGIREKFIILTHTMYCWLLKYSCAAYDCFCAPVTYIFALVFIIKFDYLT